MNILITHNGEADARGLALLREAVRTVHGQSTVVVLTPGDAPKSRLGGAASYGADLSDYDPSQLHAIDTQHYEVPGMTLADCIDLAYLQPDLWLTRGAFDLTLIGIDLGYCTGVPDVMRTTTVASGLLASAAYGAAVHVMMQRPSGLKDQFENAYEQACTTLRTVRPHSSETYVTSFAPRKPLSTTYPPLSHYSGFRRPPVTVVPRSRDERSAATDQEAGMLTHTKLSLRVNPELRY